MIRNRSSICVASACLVAAAMVIFMKRPVIPPRISDQASNSANPKSHAEAKLKPRPAFAAPGVLLAMLPKPLLSPHPPGSVEGKAWLAERVAALQDLGWFDDVESFQKILAELRNPLPEIRAAAIAATRAYGSRDAIPHLSRIAAETGDVLEQKSLTDLVDYLNLPTMIEQLESESED